MAKAHQPEQGGQETVVGVVTQDSLVPALEVRLAAKRVHVNKPAGVKENITAESCRGEMQGYIAYHMAKSFVIGNIVLEVNYDYQ